MAGPAPWHRIVLPPASPAAIACDQALAADAFSRISVAPRKVYPLSLSAKVRADSLFGYGIRGSFLCC